jgi:5-formyltetrahydrofolate cyclo-ligase
MLRAAGIAGREGLTTGERARFSAAITHRILQSPEYTAAQTILSYRAVRAEVSLEDFGVQAARDGKWVAYPLCVSPTQLCALVPGKGASAWQPGTFGILEPVAEKGVVVDPSQLDLVLAPCTAFDTAGMRIGMGAGYYDRYLPQCTRATIAAVAFEVQQVADAQPEPWDVAMDMIFSEERVYRFGAQCRQPL